jgi:hypothetical protein
MQMRPFAFSYWPLADLSRFHHGIGSSHSTEVVTVQLYSACVPPILLLLSVNVSAQQGVLPSIIPAPVEMRLTEGSIDLQCPFLVEEAQPIGTGSGRS